jgi:hypothetical protein
MRVGSESSRTLSISDGGAALAVVDELDVAQVEDGRHETEDLVLLLRRESDHLHRVLQMWRKRENIK